MTSVADLQWAAGFLEGEGSFVATKEGIRVTAAQVQLWPLNKLVRMFGGVIRTNPRSPLGKQECHSWTIGSKVAAGVTMTLYSMLSPRRQGQARNALSRWRSAGLPSAERTHCPKGHEYTPENTLFHKRRPPRTVGRECRTCVLARNSAHRFARMVI